MKFMKYLILILGFGSTAWSMEIDYYKNIIFKQSELDKPLFSKNKLLPTKYLEAVLLKYKVALESLRDALIQLDEEVNAKNLVSFDPHVGDTCCEMRAFILCCFFKDKIHEQPEFQKGCLHVINNVDTVLNKIKNIIEIKLNDRKTFDSFEQNATYRDFFDHFELALSSDVTPKMRFLQLCYFLTLAKESSFGFNFASFNKKSFAPDHCKKSALGLTNGLFKDLVQSAQAELSKVSIEQIQIALEELSLLSEEFKTDLNSAIGLDGCCLADGMDAKKVAAYFPLLVVLYTSALQKEIPIVLRILRFSKELKGFSRIYQLYLPDKENFTFKAIIDESMINEYKDSIALVLDAESFDGSYDEFLSFLGNSNAICPLTNIDQDLSVQILSERLKCIELLYLLWADASMHPQFAHEKDKNVEEDNVVFKEFFNKENFLLGPLMQMFQADAKRIGCCKKNISLFYLKHVFTNFVKAVVPCRI